MAEQADLRFESCPVLRTVELIQGRWMLLLLRDLSAGVNRFSTLERSLAGISPTTLSERLKSLEDAGVITRQAYPESPPRVEYTLTPMGRDLIPLIDHMRDYGTKWLRTSNQARGATPDELKHQV